MRPQTQWDDPDPDTLFNLLFLALAGHCACFWPFMRKRFGRSALQLNGLIAMGLMYLYAMFAPCVEVMFFFAIWFGLVLMHRTADYIRHLRGWETHSRYDGVPWLVLAIVRPKPSDFVAKAFCEPVLCLISGALLYQWSPMLGWFVAAGAVSLLVKKSIEGGIEEAQLRAWRDKEIEMRARFERYRERR